jgi:hypothetical protein
MDRIQFLSGPFHWILHLEAEQRTSGGFCMTISLQRHWVSMCDEDLIL